jgi:uncharacterized protein
VKEQTMPTVTKYAPGTPCWVDLASPDLAASTAFYSSLFGWESHDQGPDAGHYHMLELGGVPVAGGTVFVEPMDVVDVGRMAVFADPTGAAAAVWQPRLHPGAGLVNEPGAITWNELSTRDTKQAASFYHDVFGWEADTNPMGDMEYTEWKLGGTPSGG